MKKTMKQKPKPDDTRRVHGTWSYVLSTFVDYFYGIMHERCMSNEYSQILYQYKMADIGLDILMN